MADKTEPWKYAVSQEMAEPAPDLTEVARDELAALWSDLSAARGRAIRSRWSMECDWLTGRIAALTRIIGATPWKKVQPDLLLDGTYTGILEAVGAVFERPDMDEVRAIQAAVR